MNVKTLVVLFLSAVVVSLPNVANAELGGTRDAKLIKAEIVQRLNQLIARHETMSKDQIVADYQQQIALQVTELQSSGFTRAQINEFQAYATKGLTEFAGLNKSSILALENTDLQRVLAADNIIVYLTQRKMRPGGGVTQQNNEWWNSDFLPLAVVNGPQMLAQILIAIH